MKTTGKRFKWTALLLALVMVVAVGCQSVGSVNLDKVLLSTYDYESLESKSTIELEVTMDELTASFLGIEADQLELFRKIRLEFHEIKQEDLLTASAAGTLSIANTDIPFDMYVDANQVVISVAGIDRPIVLDSSADMAFLLEMLSMTPEEYYATYVDAVKAMAAYFVPNLPNPDKIEYKREPISINGENVFTSHVRTVIQGDELIPFAQKLLNQLAADQEGLREALEKAYDISLPFAERAIELLKEEEFLSDGEGATFIRLLESYMHNKTLVVEFLATTITFGLEEALILLEGAEEQAKMMQEQMGVHILNENSHVAFDLYVDDSQTLRRTDFELVLQPETSLPVPVNAGIRLYTSQEYWNINDKPVKADVIDTEDGIMAYDLGSADAILAEIDADSALGQLFISQGWNVRQFTVIVDDEDMQGSQPFIQEGHTMVSAFWLVNKLGLDWDLDWDEDSNTQFFFIDPVSGRTLTVVFGSDIAILDGEEVQMGTAAVEQDYSYFVPLRFVAETFGAEVEYDAETRTVTVTKRLF